jgi:hypothetical protein
MFVEQIPFRWADKITVERDGDNLYVYGENIVGAVWTDPEPQSPDLLRAYSEFSKQSKPMSGHLRGGRLAPHVQFANADSDEQLIKFVSRYGPVNGLRVALAGKTLPKGQLTAITVTETLQRLRRERMIFVATIRLANNLSTGSDIGVANALGDLVSGCSQPVAEWELSWDNEWHGQAFLLKLSHLARAVGCQVVVPLDEIFRGLKGESVREYGGYMLCLVLNSFPSMLIPATRGLIEMPFFKTTGILPALYFMLRRDCLLDQEIRMCNQRDCGKFFKVERQGQLFCSADCSQLQRQRDYWAHRGKTLRTQRMAHKQTKKGGKKRGTV